jgi:putative ATPase
MEYIPLAERLRPKTLDEIVGQPHLTGSSGFITRMIQQKKPLSILLFGPPGSGKTSIAKLYAQAFDLRFVGLSAVWDGIGELKKIIKEISDTPLFQKQVLLFVDEIHRFNKAQQDAFLPFVEKGTVILVGATAENPSFYLNPALLSRLRVLELYPLQENDLETLLERYERLFKPLPLTQEARSYFIQLAQGDGRYLLNLIENIEHLPETEKLGVDQLQELIQKRAQLYDRAAEQHYNLISALHKSVRGSDPDAALYWFARMLEGGEDPLYLARRMIRMAAEDIGLADPDALPLAIAGRQAYESLGSPEGELALAEVLIYLALAPKSNSLYTAFKEARLAAQKTGHLPPPKIILNAPTRMMKDLGYGKGYEYDHDAADAFSGQNYFPDGVERCAFYHPVERGFEREMRKRLKYFQTLRTQKHESD